jgi:hypothetical protein
MSKNKTVELMDSHVTAYKRHHGIHDSHIERRERFKASLHDSYVARYFEYLAKTNKPSDFRDATEDGVKAMII